MVANSIMMDVRRKRNDSGSKKQDALQTDCNPVILEDRSNTFVNVRTSVRAGSIYTMQECEPSELTITAKYDVVGWRRALEHHCQCILFCVDLPRRVRK